MANSRFGYVRDYELSDALLPGTFLVVRLDGKGFHRFADQHAFEKPNDRRALDLINAAALRTMESETLRQHVLLAFGESDEYSFLLAKTSTLFNRRESKIVSTFVSIFTASYCILWSRYFPNDPLNEKGEGPSFDGRVVQYPSEKEVMDYFKWRQADTHINNLYNTAFWALIQQGGCSAKDAHATLSGTLSAQKHEILFSRFGINYNEIDALYRRGSILLREGSDSENSRSTPEEPEADTTETPASRARPAPKKRKAVLPLRLVHEDLLKDKWWTETRPYILGGCR